MNLPVFLKPSYWFSAYPAPFILIVDRAILILMLALFVAGIAVYVYRRLSKGQSKEIKRLFTRYAECLSTAGVAGLILYLFTWQQIPILSMRILYLVWAIGFGFWGYVILRYQFKELPRKREEREARMAYEKWLPKKKKK